MSTANEDFDFPARDELSWFSEFESHILHLVGKRKVAQIKALSPTGRDRITFRLVMSDGTFLILKWFSSRQAAKTHHHILESLSDTDIPHPSPIGFVEFSSNNGSVVLMEHLPGVVWYECAGISNLDCSRIDAAVALLIRFESLNIGSLGWRRVSPDCCAREPKTDAEDYARRMREIPFPPIAEEANKMLMSLAVEPWGQIADHGDFGPHNLLCEDVVLTGLIDWDRAAIQDRSVAIGTAAAEVLAMPIPIEQRRALVDRFFKDYATGLRFDVSECRWRALPHALTRTLDWLCYQKGAPAEVHMESLKELLRWKS